MKNKSKFRTVELFAGTKSFSKVAKYLGHETWTTDNDSIFDCDLTGDILTHEIQDQIMEHVKKSDIVWMSPVCTTWSLSAGNTYWDQFRMPRSEKAIEGIKMMMFCRLVADYCIKNKKIFFIENPNGRAVWIMDNQYLKRCWYCQYGDTRAKPTNIWTNLNNWNPKVCKNYNSKQVKGLDKKHCHHESAPRGSKTGTQGLKDSVDRSRIPSQLFIEIFETIKFNFEKRSPTRRWKI